MKNSEIYKNANDQIKAEEKLKRLTKNRIFERKHYSRLVLKLANASLILLLVFSIAWLSINNQNKGENQVQSMLTPNKSTAVLPKVGSSEKLVTMLEELQEKNRYSYFALEDGLQLNSESQEISETKEYSNTNEQVEGVSEADNVKIDGKYLYKITERKLSIVEAETLQVAYKIDYNESDFIPNQMFLKDNYLVVLGNKMHEVSKWVSYYDLASTGNTCAIVYDVTNKEEIKEIRKVELNGYLLTARMIDNTVYLISNQYIYLTEETKENPELLRPAYFDSIISEETQKVEFSEICYFPGDIEDSSYLVVASFDVNKDEKANIQTYLGAGSNVYCSKENLYVTKARYEYNLVDQAKTIIGISNYTGYTEIYRFALKNGEAVYEANGKVTGYVLNQFSMDEQNGYLRIATTTNTYSEEQSNALYVLNQDLNIVGTLENLAKGERIYSVRYMGEKAYVVTFKQTDPLFVIDLSNPYTPKVLGELKIPGFSNYLHPYDEIHLIGIGQDTMETNGNVVTNGMKISLFDVEDVTAPKEIWSIKIGERGTYSEALYNHKAVLFSKEKNLLAFPITVMENVKNQTKITLDGAIIYDISEDSISEKARIANEQNEGVRQIAQRCLYIGDTLYVCTTGSIRAFDLNTMQEIGSVEL